MNKDELDPHPGNLRKHEVEPGRINFAAFFSGQCKWLQGLLDAKEQENEALRKENQMLREQLASISAIKNEEEVHIHSFEDLKALGDISKTKLVVHSKKVADWLKVFEAFKNEEL